MMSTTSQALPDLSSAYAVSEESVNEYREKGHTLLRGICSTQEIAAWRQVIREVTLEHGGDMPPMEERDTYHKAFIQVGNVWQRDIRIAGFTLATRFGQIVADILGVDAVRMYHDQALFKEPSGGMTPWHQDQHYWPLETNQAITMWMPLVDCEMDMGPLTFASSTHDGPVYDEAISDESHKQLAHHVAENKIPVAVNPLRAGDATFHAGWNIHMAPANRSETMREIMTVIFYPDGVRLRTDCNEDQLVDLEAWYPGAKPGDMAASDLTPVVFKR